MIFYGQEDGPLASQLLLLAPGAYRLAMPVTGDTGHARSLVWTLTCANSNTPVGRFALELGRGGARLDLLGSGRLPRAEARACRAYRADMPQQVDVTIPRLQLERQGG